MTNMRQEVSKHLGRQISGYLEKEIQNPMAWQEVSEHLTARTPDSVQLVSPPPGVSTLPFNWAGFEVLGLGSLQTPDSQNAHAKSNVRTNSI